MKTSNLKEIASVFFKLGLFAFGGPAAHIAMMEAEIIEKRKWMTHQEFLDLIGATNIIPGPNSTEMTMHCGYKRGGTLGLFLAGFSFIFPAVIITVILAYLYTEYGSLPAVEPFIKGITPAVLAVIAAAVFKLGKKALKGWELGVIGLFVFAAAVMGVHEIIALLAGGILGMIYFQVKNGSSKDTSLKNHFSLLTLFSTQTAGSVATSLKVMGTFKIFITFLKVGSILYGSGYVLFAYLEPELVATGLLSMTELTDAIGAGQFTPGPVLSTATFIGYQLGGFSGALAATLGIFLPSFIFVWLFHDYMLKMRGIKILSYFLDAINISALAVMLAVLIQMGIESMSGWRAILIAVISIGYTFFTKKPNAIYTIAGGAILGWILYSFVM